MAEWKNDKELFQIMKEELYSGVLLDMIDTLGHYNQYLPREIQSMRPGDVIVGRAYPTVICDVYGPQEKPLGELTSAVDNIKEDEIYIVTGGNYRCCYFGEIMTATIKSKGAVGAIIDGYHRDTNFVLEQDFPVFSRGRDARGSGHRNLVIRYRVPVDIGGVWIEPGDLIFADIDGVVVIPKKIEEEAVTISLDKVRSEKDIRIAIEGGMSAVDAYDKFGTF